MIRNALLSLAIATWVAACGGDSGMQAPADMSGCQPGGCMAPDDMPASHPEGCMATGGTVMEFSSLDDIKAMLTNKWGYCSGEPANFKEPTEFTADGHWYRLTRDANGQLARKGGFSGSGSYTLSADGPPPWTYVNMVFHSDETSSTLETNLSLMDVPREMLNGPGIYVPIR